MMSNDEQSHDQEEQMDQANIGFGFGDSQLSSSEAESRKTGAYLDEATPSITTRPEGKIRNGNDELDVGMKTQENPQEGQGLDRRQRKLTEKGKSYRLTELRRQRTRSKREIEMRINSIESLMTLEENAMLVSREILNLNSLLSEFCHIHEEILNLLEDDDEEVASDSEMYKAICQEILKIQAASKSWMQEIDSRARNKKSTKGSVKSSARSRVSKHSNASSTSSRAKFLEAKAKQAELQAKLAVFDKIATAEKRESDKKREVERVKLMADCEVAAAVSKVYEDAERENEEQALGSDDPDAPEYRELPRPGMSPFKPCENETVVIKPSEKQELGLGHRGESKLNPRADEFKFENGPLQSTVYQNKGEWVQKPSVAFHDSGTNLRNDEIYTHDLRNQTHFATPSVNEPPSALWEKMELRMSQPPPKPTPFDGDPARYLRFRSNFRDQVESKLTLSDSEKMNYLMSYTTGRAREPIETYEGLPNGYQLALNVLQQRFGQNAMIVQALKSSVVAGPRIRASDSASLLAFSDKIQNCYWSMRELNSKELDCTTNLKLIYDRLPDSLQRKWRKEASFYREKTKGKEPTLKELCAFISAESQIENDPVYGANESLTFIREKPAHYARNPKTTPNKSAMQTKTKIPTFTTQVEGENNMTSHVRTDKTPDACKVCKKEKHELTDCAVFASKNLKWRRRFARYGKLCYRCLAGQHKQSECPLKEGCKVKNCTFPLSHHSLLHLDVKPDSPSDDKENEVSGTINQHATSSVPGRNFVMLKVVPVRVVTESGKEVTTYALLDTAAVSSMITSQLAQELQLQGTPERVSINTVVQNNHECVLPNVSFTVTSTTQDCPSFQVRRALVVDDLNVPERYCPNQVDLSAWPHLGTLQLPTEGVGLEKISVLLGQDVPQAHVVDEYCWGDDPPNQPYGMKTPFAWCVAGPTNSKEEGEQPIALSIFNHCDRDKVNTDMMLHKQVEKFWTLDSQGLSSNDDANSVEDARALDILENTTRLTEQGGYEVGLLWRNDDVRLPNNRKQAEQRLEQLKKRFKRDENFAEKYKMVMDDYIKKGYAKKLSKEEAASTSDITWYLPHHGVVNPNKPKVRVVYDAAAEYKGVSLNKELLQGPQLNNSLIGVLLRFREEKVAVASDIEGMFHQVSCLEKDTDALRFLWWSEGVEEPPSDHKMAVHLFGKADSPCIAAWALKKTANDHGHEFGREISEVVKKNFYVDDCLVSTPSPDQAIELAHGVTQLLKKGNFRLTKFVSNSKEVLAAIPAEERTTKDLDLDRLPIERALGVQWHTESDTFGVKAMSNPEKYNRPTRRDCLSILSSTFDPLGVVGPVLLQAKKLVQRTWQLKLGWDDELPEDLRCGWNNWKADLALLNQVSIPRCYFTSGSSNSLSLQIHHFSDASEVGYGTVSYLRKESTDGRVECAFVMAKSRTAPVQYVSTPRLELQAATVAVRVHCLIMKEIDLKISEVYFWTDSKLTLQYINNESRRFKTYVANRVTEIREVSQPSQWRHCPGNLNPADDASRGLSAKELLKNERWLQGPDFLSKSEEHWPHSEIGDVLEDEAEVKNERPVFMVTAPDKLQELLTRYSSWAMLLRKVAWLLKFKEYLKQRCLNRDTRSDIDKNLTTEDLESATKAIVKLVQRQVYPQEMRELERSKPVKLTSSIVKLHPVLIENILRVGGRITEAPTSFDSKHPMIVPSSHHVTRLLIEHFHQKLAHAGQEHILAQMRERFWIPKGRSVVRKVVRTCLTCRKYKATAMEQMMAALPAFRTTAYEPCFTHTGVDYFGPLSIKRGRAVVKRWGALFTCLNSRAVHLELASTLETDCFLNLLRRFVNRRGAPKFIYSDNGTNFVGAEREIREAIEHWNQKQISNELLQRGIQWVFQPPKASHASGVWERLIRSTRKALKAILGESLVDEEVATTVLTEVESVLNSRPLCAASDDPSDLEPLTPNHLLLQRPVQALPPGVFVDEDIYHRKKWRQTQILADHFWKRWLREYIPALQERQKWNRIRRNAEVGDIVLLIDHSIPRGKWLLGRVLKTFPGRDGLVRTVEVKTQSSTLIRPIQKLCLLEETLNTG